MRITLEDEQLPATLPIEAQTEFDRAKQLIAFTLKAKYRLDRHFTCTFLISTNSADIGRIAACILNFGGPVSPNEHAKLKELYYTEVKHPVTGKWVYIREMPPWETVMEGIAAITAEINK